MNKSMRYLDWDVCVETEDAKKMILIAIKSLVDADNNTYVYLQEPTPPRQNLPPEYRITIQGNRNF